MPVPSVINRTDRTEQRARWLQIGWALFGLALFAMTWRLWVAPAELGPTDFPQVPLLALGQLLPRHLDRLGFVGILLSLAWSATMTLWPRPSSEKDDKPENCRLHWLPIAVFCTVGGLLVLANQHRLQPWAYLAWLTAFVLLVCRPGRAVFLLRLMMVSVYLHSAVSKLDHEFLTTLGQTFLSTLTNPVTGNVDWLQDQWGSWNPIAVSVFPVTESVIGFGLCFRASRRWAVMMAVAMHIMLIGLLGPWGLGHEPGVLIWNLYFIWQAATLFGWREHPEHLTTPTANSGTTHRHGARHAAEFRWKVGEACATTLVGLAVALPMLESFGRFDHWLSWGLYAPRNSRCRLFIDEDARQRLPESWLRGATSSFDEQYGWTLGLEIQLSRQSLDRLDVPIYPQDRFQLGVALAIARRYGLEENVHAVLESASDRITGKRRREVLHGLAEIEAATDRFWFSAQPRQPVE